MKGKDKVIYQHGMEECMCMNYFLCKQKQRKLHPHLSVWEIQIWKCYHFSLSTIDNFELKDYFVTIICQIVSWYCSFKRPEFQILIKIIDRVFQKNISQIWKLLEKLKNSIFFSLVAIYTPSPVFKCSSRGPQEVLFFRLIWNSKW